MFAVVILPVVIAAVAIVAVPDTEALAPVNAPEAVTLPPVITPETEADPDTFNPAPVRVPAVVRFPAVKVPVNVPVFPETALLTTKELPVISPDVFIVATLVPPVPVTLKRPVILVVPIIALPALRGPFVVNDVLNVAVAAAKSLIPSIEFP